MTEGGRATRRAFLMESMVVVSEDDEVQKIVLASPETAGGDNARSDVYRLLPTEAERINHLRGRARRYESGGRRRFAVNGPPRTEPEFPTVFMHSSAQMRLYYLDTGDIDMRNIQTA